VKSPTLSTTARSFSAAQPPSSSSSEFTAEKRLGKKSRQKGKSKEKEEEISAQKSCEPNQHHKFIRSLTFRSSSDPSKARVTTNWGQAFFFWRSAEPLSSPSPQTLRSGEQQAQIPPQAAAADMGQNN
jgi:hypothetical protein